MKRSEESRTKRFTRTIRILDSSALKSEPQNDRFKGTSLAEFFIILLVGALTKDYNRNRLSEDFNIVEQRLVLNVI